ncbi:hypothetical protein Efla_003204 [Eimeria flavescens]
MHSQRVHSILPVGLPPPPPLDSMRQQQPLRGGSGEGGPDLLASLKPCALPEDMPLPVSNSRAAAAAAAAAAEDDDDGGFDWQGLARAPPQQQRQQKPKHEKGSAEALAAASQRIAVVTGAASSAASAKPPVKQSRSAAKAGAPADAAEGPVDGTDVLGRKVWDKEYYEAKAKEKAAAAGADEFMDLLPKPREKPKPPPLPPCGYRQQLKQRTFQLDFEREVGKTKMVTLQTPRMQQGGFWCDICECLCKDSQSYLDHINGRNHNRILGMSMRVERVPLPRVKAKLQAARRELAAEAEGAEAVKTEGSSKGPSAAVAGGSALGGPEAEDEFDRVKRRIEELQREQELKKQRKKEKKRKAASANAGSANTASAANTQDSAAANPDAAALAAMGLPTSFAGC